VALETLSRGSAFDLWLDVYRFFSSQTENFTCTRDINFGNFKNASPPSPVQMRHLSCRSIIWGNRICPVGASTSEIGFVPLHRWTEARRVKQTIPGITRKRTAYLKKSSVFWDAKTYRLVEGYRRFGGVYCLHLQGRGVSSRR
jgi:hypothetical protein